MLQRQNYLIVTLVLSVVFANSAIAIERDHDAMQHDSDHEQHDGMNHSAMSGKQSPMNEDGQHAEHSVKREHEDPPLRADHVTDGGHGEHDSMRTATDLMNSGKRSMPSVRAREESTLAQLETYPASGKSREAGYDGRYTMEATRHDDDIAAVCAKASRGLVMIDNATLVRCGGKAAEIFTDISDKTVSMDHSSHSMD